MVLQTSTHYIISITAARTQYGKRMWRCKTRDGVDVNIFASNLHLFGDYCETLQTLDDNQIMRWTHSPINVVLSKDGEYLNVVSVAPRSANAIPDKPFVPQPSLSAQVAAQWASDILTTDAVIWDTETTGTDRFYDEIVSIGIVRIDGTVLLNQVIRPQNLTRNAESGAQSVNGFSLDELVDAPAFSEVYPDIRAALQGKPWVIYNAAFDTVILERSCLRHELVPVMSSGVNCAMEWYARFNEDWDVNRQSYRSKKLVEAAEMVGLEVDQAHDALADASMTLGIIHRMAYGIPF